MLGCPCGLGFIVRLTQWRLDARANNYGSAAKETKCKDSTMKSPAMQKKDCWANLMKENDDCIYSMIFFSRVPYNLSFELLVIALARNG